MKEKYMRGNKLEIYMGEGYIRSTLRSVHENKLIWRGLSIEEMYTEKAGQKSMGKTVMIIQTEPDNSEVCIDSKFGDVSRGLNVAGKNSDCFEWSYSLVVAAEICIWHGIALSRLATTDSWVFCSEHRSSD